MTKENLKYAFRFLDKDNSKTLNAQKIISAFLTKPNKEFEAIFNITIKEVDKDSDGIINFNEYYLLKQFLSFLNGLPFFSENQFSYRNNKSTN